MKENVKNFKQPKFFPTKFSKKFEKFDSKDIKHTFYMYARRQISILFVNYKQV